MKILITEQQLKTLSEVRYLRPPNYMTKNYGDEKPISDTETIRVFHGKKKCKMFCILKKLSYLCNI